MSNNKYEIGTALQTFNYKYAQLMEKGLTGGTAPDLRRVLRMADFFAANCNGVYKTKLFNLMFLADVHHFNEYGRTISGLVYMKTSCGVIPSCAGAIEFLMIKKIPTEYGVNDRLKYVERNPCDNSCFLAEEVETMDYIAKKYYRHATNGIIRQVFKDNYYIQSREHGYIEIRVGSALPQIAITPPT